MKEILSPSTKNTVTEVLINKVCQLILSSHTPTTTYYIAGEWQSLRIIKLKPAKVSNICYKKKEFVEALVYSPIHPVSKT